MRTYTIELRADFVDEAKHDILLEMARTAARELLANALILKDKREPQISLETGDMFETNKDMFLLEESEEAQGE